MAPTDTVILGCRAPLSSPEVFAKKRYIATAAVGPCVFAKRTVNNHQIIYPNQKSQSNKHSNTATFYVS